MATDNTAHSEMITTLVQAGIITGGVHVQDGAATVAVPHNLPAGTRHFVGRDAELDRLTALASAELGSRLCVVDGAPGIGKTAFTVHWGGLVRDLFPDGQLYVDLRGFDPRRAPIDPETATRMILDALHVPVRARPSDPDGQLALLRSSLDERRLLLIIDNVRDTDQVRPLLPGSRHCFTVVTARRRLDGLSVHHGVERIPLRPLTDEEAMLLLGQRLGRQRVRSARSAAERVVTACGGHPLALSVVAARALADPADALDVVVDELEDKHAALDALKLTDTVDLRAVFALSYDNLPPALANAFRVLALHPGFGADVRSAAAMTGASTHNARATLGELVRCHLLERTSGGHYVFHALTKVFGLEQSLAFDLPQEHSEVHPEWWTGAYTVHAAADSDVS